MDDTQPDHLMRYPWSTDRRLRITICLSFFHPVVGGAERQLLQLARRWAAWGHAVRVITRPVGGAPRHEVVDQIEIHRSLYTLSLGPLFGLTFVTCLTANLLRLASRSDLVIAAQAPWEAVATGLVRRLSGKPTAVRLANAGPYGDLRQLKRATGTRLLTWLVKSNRRFFALSDQSRAELLQLGCSADEIRSITNGVDTQFFVPPKAPDEQRDRTVLFVGRLSNQKNPLSLIRSWQRVNTAKRYRLLLVGDGPLAPSIRQLIKDQQLSEIELLGPRRDLVSLYQQASVFVLPSLSEGCSNALLEAMACGVCPVVTNIGGNRDVVVDNVHGRLVEPDADQQLSDVLSALLTNKPMRDRLATAARHHVVTEHDMDSVARRYLDEFVRLVE